MRSVVGTLTTLALLLTVLVAPANASSPIYVYSPVANKSWWYSNLDHPGYLGPTAARDVTHSTWTSDEDVRFTTGSSASVQAYVERATVNCATGGPDKYVILQLYGNDLYYGKVGYIHLRTLNVAAGNWISPGTVLGKIQNAQSWNNGQSCWEGVHVHMETDVGSWTSASTYQQQSYSTRVLSYANPLLSPGMTPQQLATEHTDSQLPSRGPVR